MGEGVLCPKHNNQDRRTAAGNQKICITLIQNTLLLRVLAFAEWLFGTGGKPDYFLFARPRR
jgi:hypothetical protein